MKKDICQVIDEVSPELIVMSDEIFDHPELGLEEFFASAKICEYLEKAGFAVEHGIADIATAFRAVWENGTGGPSIGLLCEYDALESIGHACGHHTQCPSILAAAVALKSCAQDEPFKLVVYGTPAEETCASKVAMLERGCFQDIDVALMMHPGPDTCVDKHSRALDEFEITFHGKSAHAAIAPELGRSAFDAVLLSFNGVEFLREHVRDDVRIHYTVLDAGGPANVVPEKATAYFELRSFDGVYLTDVIERFKRIVQGAAMMTDTTVEINNLVHMESKIPVFTLNDLFMEKAKLINAPGIAAPREATGSTDFGNVMNRMPGCCIRVKFVASGTPAHSQGYLDAGKSEAAHEAIKVGAKVLALASADMITDHELFQKIQEEFKHNREAALRTVR